MPQDTNPVVPVDPTMAPVTNVTPAPVVPANETVTVTETPAVVAPTETVMDATQVVPGPETVKVELPEIPAATTPVATPTV